MKNICVHKDNKISFLDIPKHYACVQDGKVVVVDERWITINADPDEPGHGQHVLIKENGDIVAGLGGNFKNLRDLKRPKFRGMPKGNKEEIERAKNTTLHSYGRARAGYERRLLRSIKLTQEEVQRYKDNLKEIFENSDYAIDVPTDDLMSILNSAEYRNQIDFWEIEGKSKTMGEDDPELRKSTSGYMFGNDRKDKNGNELKGADYEKYGYLLSKNPADFEEEHERGYGGVTIRLKKDNFRGRTTYVIGDSLWKGVVAGDADSPSIAGFDVGNIRRTKGNIGNIERLANLQKVQERDAVILSYNFMER